MIDSLRYLAARIHPSSNDAFGKSLRLEGVVVVAVVSPCEPLDGPESEELADWQCRNCCVSNKIQAINAPRASAKAANREANIFSRVCHDITEKVCLE